MKILFVENRYKTDLWEIIARVYQDLGHEIHWIVQNAEFTPSIGKVHIIPYPKKSDLNKVKKTANLDRIIHTNRGIRYFEIQNENFIFYYNDRITSLIETIQPNLAFGEATAFHELLVIKSCEENKILYLNPCTSRYPSKRFSFYKFDTTTPYFGSNETYSEDEAISFVNEISGRKVKPDYMKNSQISLTNQDKIKDKLKLIKGFYRGEKYNTPSPFVKRKLNKISAKNIRHWDQLSTPFNQIIGEFKLLYPLQMQPEANIDVWGHPHSDQHVIIRETLKQLRKNEVLILKPNPKSKYEIDDQILDLIKSNPKKLYCLHHSSSMTDIWNEIHLILTVTGTVSIECVFSNKPIVMLGDGIQLEQKNCIKIDSYKQIPAIIDQIKTESFPKLTLTEKQHFLNRLVSSSYQGIVADGLNFKDHLQDDENKKLLISAFKNILNRFEHSN